MTGSMEVVGQKSNNTTLLIRRIVAYVVLTILVFISLFPFYLLLINATRERKQTGIQYYPGPQLINNSERWSTH